MLDRSSKLLKEPLLTLPEDCTDLRIALRLTGGVGDVLMAIGGSAEAIKRNWPSSSVSAFVMEHQIELLSCIEAIDVVEFGISLNYPKTRSGFDVIVDFTGCFANNREIRAKEYYTLVSEKLGLAVGPPKLHVNWVPEKICDRKVVAIHPGASNPNRRWPNYKWQILTEELVKRGLYVVFLGTWDEFSFEKTFVRNASDLSDSLVDQIEILASCHYFIGNDSGFAHIAGILGIPGTVIFSATIPEHVISRYPSLQATHCYDRLIMEPSRSLRIDCGKARQALEFISVEDVLENLPFSPVEFEKELA